MISIRLNDLTWSDAPILAAADETTAKAFKRVGAYVRRTAQQSLGQDSSAASTPGAPPTNRTERLRRTILFAYEPEGPSVVIGPRLLPRKKRAARTSNTLERLESRFPYMAPAAAREFPKAVQFFKNAF